MISLNEALEYGIIDVDHLQRQIEMKKKEKILSDHPYKISLGSDGRWRTYIPDKIKGRIMVVKTKKEDLEDFLVSFYSKNELSFGDVYDEWRTYHDQMIVSNSAAKYDSDKLRYFDGTSFFDMPIGKIIEDDVSVFVKGRIGELRLCKSAAKSMFYYISRTCQFAVRKGYIPSDPTFFLKPKDFYKYCEESVRSKKKKVLETNECVSLNKKYETDLAIKPNYVPLYAVIFASLTGMRAGEIAALKWDDVKKDFIVVNKSQKYDVHTKIYYIDHTKNGKDRLFPLTDETKDLLRRLYDVEKAYGYLTDFVFSDESGPISYRKICSCIKNKCRQIGMDTYGIHVYRRTLNSHMAHNSVPGNVRAEILGHTKEVNEQYYTFDVSSMEEKRKIVSDANPLLPSSL